MTLISAFILGVVEGVTEFLPISSTGHLILTSHLLGLGGEFVKSFEIMIQLGAILAVVVLYGSSRFLSLPVLKRLVVAFIPTGIIGLALYKIVKSYLLGSSIVVVISLALGGLVLIIFERLHTEKETSLQEIEGMSYKQAALIGCFQSIAIIPGVSRSAATIVGGLALGISRTAIVEFSFLLAVPTMLAATGLDLFKNGLSFSSDQYLILIVGFATAFVTAWFSIRWLLSFIKTHTFTSFGYYRIIIALIFATFLL